DKIKVLHDGVDTDYFQPDPGAKLVLPGLDLSGAAEIITYVARGMEPYRGFPEFMQALALVLKKRPEAHAVIVGDDRVAYGKKLPEGDSYRKRAEREIDLDWRRVHFTGLLPRPHYRKVLLASSVHVYLTIPFVLSWSLMEAMSAGCAIVASDVEPVREMAGERGERMALVDMKDPAAVAAAIERALIDRGFAQMQGRAAREAILARYAAEDIYAAKEAWLRAL
ncbi:MAG: glycosyltransferase, partial [Amphiplicatus sp.]